jgi:hypothetical protein
MPDVLDSPCCDIGFRHVDGSRLQVRCGRVLRCFAVLHRVGQVLDVGEGQRNLVKRGRHSRAPSKIGPGTVGSTLRPEAIICGPCREARPLGSAPRCPKGAPPDKGRISWPPGGKWIQLFPGRLLKDASSACPFSPSGPDFPRRLVQRAVATGECTSQCFRLLTPTKGSERFRYIVDTEVLKLYAHANLEVESMCSAVLAVKLHSQRFVLCELPLEASSCPIPRR